MRKLIHKFSLIAGLLVFFFIAGYLQLAYFLRAETESMQRRHDAIEVKEQVNSLNTNFILIRFYEKSILTRSTPEAEKKFGALMVQEKESLNQLLNTPVDSEIKAILNNVLIAVDQYETIFNKLVQTRTEERLGHTQIESTYKAILSNMFRRNEIELLRPLFTLSHFQQSYFANHRESEFQALALVVKSLRGKLAKSEALDPQVETYLNSYEEQLEKDFFLEFKKLSFNKEFDAVSLGLSTHFDQGAGLARRIAEQEEERLAELRNKLYISFVGSIGISLIGVLSILALLARRIINPVGSLARVARSIRKGNMDVRFNAVRDNKDEISRLGIDFNTMLDTLSEREQELIEHRTNLTEMIESRTRKLKTANDSLNLEITSRVKVEQELRQSGSNLLAEKEQLTVTLRSIGDGVITTDTSGRVVLVNRVAETLTGWSQQEAVGLPLDKVFVIQDEKGTVCSLVEEDDTSRPMSTTRLLITRDGEGLRVDASDAVIRNQDNKRVGVVIVFRDISEREQMEKELQKIQKLESVGILAGGIAHDFNNILMAILGNINLAAELIEPDHKASRLLKEAEKASKQARALTQQLLTFAKGGDPVIEIADLNGLFRDSISFLLRGSGVACVFDVPDNLWPVNVDTGQIGQVIQNLILNAMEAMPEGGKINVSCENIGDVQQGDLYKLKPGDYVRISVQDTGIGIKESVLENIFDPYFSTKQEGSGLGLSIIHSIITKHGGHIAASSTEGQGSCFSFYLPAARDGSVKEDEDEEAESEPVDHCSRIMIMDDEKMVRDIAAHMLTHFGHKVVQVKDGDEAIARYRKQQEQGKPIDLVIMDLTIPGGMGGKEAVKRLLAEFPDARVIVSSGYSNDPVMANFRDYGFVGVMSKPFDLVQIKGLLAELLD